MFESPSFLIWMPTMGTKLVRLCSYIVTLLSRHFLMKIVLPVRRKAVKNMRCKVFNPPIVAILHLYCISAQSFRSVLSRNERYTHVCQVTICKLEVRDAWWIWHGCITAMSLGLWLLIFSPWSTLRRPEILSAFIRTDFLEIKRCEPQWYFYLAWKE